MRAEPPVSSAIWRLANGHDPLPADEQRRLMRLASDGDETATETLILTNLRFIIGQALRLGRGQNVELLAQAGMIGMLEAIRRYDPARANGSVPMAYAGYWIVLHIVNELGRLKVGAVRVPRRVMKAYRNGSLEEPERAKVEMTFAAPCQLHEQDAQQGPPDSAVNSKIDAAALLEHLEGREQQIVRMRFLEEMELSDIAKSFRITRQRVDQIVVNSLARMRSAAMFAPQATAWQTATR